MTNGHPTRELSRGSIAERRARHLCRIRPGPAGIIPAQWPDPYALAVLGPSPKPSRRAGIVEIDHRQGLVAVLKRVGCRLWLPSHHTSFPDRAYKARFATAH